MGDGGGGGGGEDGGGGLGRHMPDAAYLLVMLNRGVGIALLVLSQQQILPFVLCTNSTINIKRARQYAYGQSSPHSKHTVEGLSSMKCR